jgi:ferredoxin-type protein NapH
MNKLIRNTFYKKLNFFRKTAQIISLLFLIAVPVLIVNEFYYIYGNLYSITIFGVDIVDPAMALQTFILSWEFVKVMLIGMLIPIIIASIFGKIFCSWMCPFNTISEYWEKIVAKIFKKRRKISRLQTVESNPPVSIYWTVLSSLFVITLLVNFPLLAFLSAPGIISSEISHYVMGMGIGLELGVIFLILLVEGFFFKRIWCKYVCPVGGVLSIFRFKKTLRINHDPAVCTCAGTIDPCSLSCPLGLSPKDKGLYPYCYNCGRCIMTCEKTGFGALSFGFGANNKSVKESIENSKTEENELLVKE